MRHLFSSPLGSCAPPCAPTNKMNPLAAAEAFSSFAGGLFNLASTMDTNDSNKAIAFQAQQNENYRTEQTNKANKEIADEANRYNKLLQDEQNAWNLEQWNRQNEYNSPSEQVKRLKAAGINPYALYGSAGGSVPAGQLESAQAKDAVVAQMQKPGMVTPPQMIAPQLDMPSLSAIRLQNAQADKLNADTQIAHAQEKRNADMFPFQLKYTEQLAKEKGYLGDMARETLQYYQLSRKYELAKLMNDIRGQSESFRTMQEQRENVRLNNQLLRIEAMYAPQMNSAKLLNFRQIGQKIKAEIGLLEANKMLTDEQRLHEIEKKWNTISEGDAKYLDNSLKRDLYTSTIEMYKWDVRNKEKTARAFGIGPFNFSPGYKESFFDFGY